MNGLCEVNEEPSLLTRTTDQCKQPKKKKTMSGKKYLDNMIYMFKN